MVRKILIIGIIGFLLIMLSKKVTRNNAMNQSPEEKQKDVIRALSDIIKKYGRQSAEIVEQLFRLETAHFTSVQWKVCNTAGMEVFAKEFPYGWSTLKKYADQNGLKASDFSTYTMTENRTGKQKTFIVFPNAYTSFMFVAFLLNSRGWNAGSWYSTDPIKQMTYMAKLTAITPKLTNAL